MRRDKIIRSRFPSGAMVAAAATLQVTTLKDSLIAFWELEEASGVRYDSHSNHLNLSESGSVSRVTGIIGYAGYAGGASNTLSIDDNVLFDFTAGITVVFWVKFTTLPYYGTLVHKLRTSHDWGVRIWTGNLRWVIFDSLNTPVVLERIPAGLSTDVWYFIAARADNTILSLSVNDDTPTTISQDDLIINHSAEPVWLWDYDNDCLAAIDQVGIWNRALSDPEITALYAGGSGLAYADM